MASFGALSDTTSLPYGGFRFVVTPVVPPTSVAEGLESLILARISEVQLPRVDIVQTVVPTLSTREIKIPSKIVYGDLVLRGGEYLDSSPLWKQIQKQIDVLDGLRDYQGTAVDLLIVQLGHPSNALSAVPIASWVCKNCQAKSYTPAPNNANTDTIPLQELVMSVSSIQKQF